LRLFGLRWFIAYSEFHQRQLVDGSDPTYNIRALGLIARSAPEDTLMLHIQPSDQDGAMLPGSSARFARIN